MKAAHEKGHEVILVTNELGIRDSKWLKEENIIGEGGIVKHVILNSDNIPGDMDVFKHQVKSAPFYKKPFLMLSFLNHFFTDIYDLLTDYYSKGSDTLPDMIYADFFSVGAHDFGEKLGIKVFTSFPGFAPYDGGLFSGSPAYDLPENPTGFNYIKNILYKLLGYIFITLLTLIINYQRFKRGFRFRYDAFPLGLFNFTKDDRCFVTPAGFKSTSLYSLSIQYKTFNNILF